MFTPLFSTQRREGTEAQREQSEKNVPAGHFHTSYLVFAPSRLCAFALGSSRLALAGCNAFVLSRFASNPKIVTRFVDVPSRMTIMAAPARQMPQALGPFEQLRLAREVVRSEGQTLLALADRLGEEFCHAAALLHSARGSVIVSLGAFTSVPVCCVGNADKIAPGSVAFADVTAVLANFGGPANPNGTSVGDADCNGAINFADITAVLANFNMPCP